MKLTIDRARWLRGNELTSCLHNDEGKMCCLGFLGLACGIDRRSLFDQATPSDVDYAPWPKWLLCVVDDADGFDPAIRDSHLCNRLMLVNDDSVMPDDRREKRLAEIFAEVGVEVEFVDGEP